MGPSKEKPNSGRFVVNQFKTLKEQHDFDVELFYLNQNKKTGLAKALRYPLFFLRFIFYYVFSLKKLSVIHVHFYFPNIALAIFYKLCRNPKVKIVVTFHGSDIYSYSPPNFVYRMCSHLVNKYIFVSDSLKRKFYRATDAKVLSAGVLDLFYKPVTPRKAKDYDLIFVGHLEKNKGIDRLVTLLNNTELTLNVVVIGTGAYQPKPTRGNCTLSYLGAKSPEELFALYHRSRYLINLSRNESFGLVMTEAMACGVPVIATETDGAIEQIEQEKNGYIWENNDTWIDTNGEDRLKAIFSLSNESYTSLSSNAIKSAERFRLSQVCSQISNIYCQLTT